MSHKSTIRFCFNGDDQTGAERHYFITAKYYDHELDWPGAVAAQDDSQHMRTREITCTFGEYRKLMKQLKNDSRYTAYKHFTHKKTYFDRVVSLPDKNTAVEQSQTEVDNDLSQMIKEVTEFFGDFGIKNIEFVD